MATRKEWTEFFELMNNRQASADEIAAAYANGEIEPGPEEQSFASTVSGIEAKPARKDWLEYFEMVNGRKPSLAEFQDAKAAGEFWDDNLQSSQNSSHSSTTQPQLSQEQSFQQNPQVSYSDSPRDALGRVIQLDVAEAQPTATGKVGFVEALKLFFTNYVNFSGRSSRAEYWYIALWNVVFVFILFILIVVSWTLASIVFKFGGILVLAVIVPGIAVSVRRFRDVGISHIGYIGMIIITIIIAFLWVIPILGSLALVAISIYRIVIVARPSDYYLTHKEPITDWIVKQFGKK
ncbi:DUF805 domain-containing protein [Lactovum odontotermitis]